MGEEPMVRQGAQPEVLDAIDTPGAQLTLHRRREVEGRGTPVRRCTSTGSGGLDLRGEIRGHLVAPPAHGGPDHRTEPVAPGAEPDERLDGSADDADLHAASPGMDRAHQATVRIGHQNRDAVRDEHGQPDVTARDHRVCLSDVVTRTIDDVHVRAVDLDGPRDGRAQP